VKVEARRLPVVPGFEVVRRIGRGGMGEVFQAIRIGPGGFRKSVALKQLAEERSVDGRARQRFLEEAHVSAQLEHPNLVRVHDVVVVGSHHYIVMELLRGLNLLDAANALRARGPVAWELALAVAAQVLDGLAYAHDAVDETGRGLGLVHRDLTPRNIFLCVGGTVKLLDFGIAKRQGGPQLTHSGHVHGMIELLSPEQARGDPADARSDLYQLGATMYWLLANRFPHGDGTAGELIARAATVRPPRLADLVPELPVPVIELVERAMAGSKDDRFRTAAAMAAAVRTVSAPVDRAMLASTIASLPVPDLETSTTARPTSASAEHTASLVTPSTSNVPVEVIHGSSRWWRALGGVALAGAAFVAGRGLGRDPEVASVITSAQPASPGWQQITFDVGRVGEARFVPGAPRYVYAGWTAGRMAVREGTFGKPHARLVLDDAQLVAISPQAQLLVLLHPTPITYMLRGTLARLPLAGGGPRELATDATAADIARDGETIAAIRYRPDHAWIEFPLGHVVAESSGGWYSNIRISPSGDRVAYVDHPALGDDRGFLTVLGRTGTPRRIGAEWGTIGGLAWRTADDLWITASRSSGSAELQAVTLAGTERTLQHVPGAVRLSDVGPDGRALVVTERMRERTIGDLGSDGPHYLSSVAGSYPVEVSPDGRWFLAFDGSGDTGAGDYVIYKAPIDGSSPPTELGTGMVQGLSPDGRWVLAIAKHRDALVIVPFADGQPRTLPIGTLHVDNASWFPDSRHVLLTAYAAGEAPRLYILDGDGDAPPRPFGRATLQLSPQFYTRASPVSPDGRRVLLFDRATDQALVVDVLDGAEHPARGTEPGEFASRWSSEHRVLVRRELASDLFEVDLDTGERRLWKHVVPLDPSAFGVIAMWISHDLKRSFAIEWHLDGTLFDVDGLR
jgi:serine/threonine protein kinase